MKKKSIDKRYKNLDEFYYHEALDRSYIVVNMIEDLLIEHPVIKKHKNLKKQVKKAQQLILDAYQEIGGRENELFPPKKK